MSYRKAVLQNSALDFFFFPGMIEGIVDKLISNFQKQTGAFQELLHQRLLRHKMALYSCLGPGSQRAADCRAMITLHAITTVLKSCLRPKTVTAQDKVTYGSFKFVTI